MYTLYSIPGSCSTGIHVLLKALGQDVKIVPRDDVPNYEELVPTNQVPALDDGEQLLTEGAAIALFLMEKHLGDASPAVGPDSQQFRHWLLFNYATLHPAYSKLFSVSALMEEGEEKTLLMQKLADRVSAIWAIVDRRLGDRDFLVGTAPTLLDYLIVLYANWGNSFPQLQIELGSDVERVVANVRTLPEFTAAARAEGLSL